MGTYMLLRMGLVVVVVCAFAAAAQETDSVDRDYAAELPRVKPLEPADALKSFKIHSGFHMDLVAAEPLINDPIAIAFDEFGRMYVVDMTGYSERRADNIGAIRLLTDTDDDGHYDTSSVYVEGLAWPTAVACYDGGIFVAVPPDILYLKDTDADGQADTREIVFTGFGLTNVQGLLNSFNWGLDNLIHGATSSSGATVISAQYPNDAPLVLRGRDFAIDAKTRRMTAESGGAQHGLSFDDWGHKFICHNSDQLIQIMFEDRYLARNPYYSAPGPRKSIASDGPQAEVFRISPEEPWRVVRTRLRVKGIVEGPIEGGGRASGYFTSATGVTVYRGDAYPTEYRGNVFVADVGSNLVHRKVLTRDGVGFRGDRADQGVEFLASTDNWFRPVQFANGPDGCLYVVDMYREVIEHPESLPPVIKKHLDLNSGNDRGRIYRIVPDGFQQPKIPRLGDETTIELVPLLGHANAWHAETAQRLIYQRADKAAVPALEALARGGPATGRVRALYALRSLDALTEIPVRVALHDEEPQVRRHGVRLAENFTDPSVALTAELVALAADPETEIRYQVAFTMGTWNAPMRHDALMRIARSDGADPWMTAALMSSLSSGAGSFAEGLLSIESSTRRSDSAALLEALAKQVGAVGDRRDTERLLLALDAMPVAREELRRSLVVAMLDGARDTGTAGRTREQLAQSTSARATLNAMVEDALRRAADISTPARERINSIETLAFAPADRATPVLTGILRDATDDALHTASVRALAQFDSPEVADTLIASLPKLQAGAARVVLDALFSRDAWISRLLAAAQSGAMDYGALPSTYRHRVQTHRDNAIRAAAAELEGQHASPDIKAALARLEGVAQAKGDADSGQFVFTALCAQCHQVRGIGEAVGPDLAGIHLWDTSRLLLSVVNPNAEINPQYTAYAIETNDGRDLSGILESETATSITLRMTGGSQTVLKSQVKRSEPMEISLMPEALTDGLDVQGVADLFAFLKEP